VVIGARQPGDRAGNAAGGYGVPSAPDRLPWLDRLVQKGCAMKVRSSVRSLKSRPGSVVVRRNGRVRVVNRANPRWNGRQG